MVADHIVPYDIPWNAYTRMMDALGEKHVSHVYQRGALEMWSTAERRERLKCVLRRFVDTAAFELRIPICNVGSATRRNEELEHGLEPDVSFYVGRDSVDRWRTKSGGVTKTVPNLAIEVEVARTVLAKLESYAVIGIAEVWRHHRGKVEFFVLGEDSKYDSVARSLAFPLLTPELINRSLERAEKSDDTKAMKLFLGEIKKLRKKS